MTDNYFKELDNISIADNRKCTGLKDKNGKLIYKGDILLLQWGGKIPTANSLVIGNIYENPELLEETNDF